MIRLIFSSQRFSLGLASSVISLCVISKASPGRILDFFTHVMAIGIVLLLVGIADVAAIYSKGVTGENEIKRLNTLNSRMKSGLSESMRHARNCYAMYCILVSTKYRKECEAFSLARSNSIWKRARRLSLKSSRRGYEDCDRMLKITVEYPEILLLREAFSYIHEICSNCPILEYKEGSFPGCCFKAPPEEKETNNEYE